VLTTSQIAASNLRFGDGVTQEIGMDFANMKATKVRPVVSNSKGRSECSSNEPRLACSPTRMLQSSCP